MAVLGKKFGGGPHGLGDPLDRSLRNVEVEVLIPKKMREKAKDDKCAEEVKAFNECCKSSSIFMVVTCRKENTALKNCLIRWYQDEKFKNSCKEEYLDERSEFRRTGIPKKGHDK
ncbi:COX assembly mitochondrial protein homolog [Zootermopsis nevadensis]|uniref:COX assembly mitochondrial protein n=1 Tax=Zootermopsis nevadensis TaxID=136037 RepID=A0A067RVZ1_ZOONE|nr:COX assembly mitochondrial protein homolog [Zootermopsis nevadensis]KDR24039.1 COX assembly mitochondrial protein-like protein [Zootermopsis nevadensis]